MAKLKKTAPKNSCRTCTRTQIVKPFLGKPNIGCCQSAHLLLFLAEFHNKISGAIIYVYTLIYIYSLQALGVLCFRKVCQRKKKHCPWTTAASSIVELMLLLLLFGTYNSRQQHEHYSEKSTIHCMVYNGRPKKKLGRQIKITPKPAFCGGFPY